MTNIYRLWEKVLEENNLEELKKLYASNVTAPFNVMNYAAANGKLKIMKWLYENTTEILTLNTMNKAALNGHFEVVEWLYDNMIEWHDSKTLKCAVESGNLEVLKFLFQNNQKILIEDIVKYHSQEYCINEYKEQKIECDNLMIIAVQKGFLDIVIWLYNTNKTNYDAIASINDKFCELNKEGVENHFIEYAAMSGHLEIVKWLYDHKINDDNTFTMHFAARNGHLHIVKWLYENKKEKFSYDTRYWAMRNKQYDIVQYLDSFK